MLDLRPDPVKREAQVCPTVFFEPGLRASGAWATPFLIRTVSP